MAYVVLLIDLLGFYGGRDRDRTCDPYHVKKACEVEAVGNQGTRVAVSGTGSTCSKDVPRPVVAYDQRALPITGIPEPRRHSRT
jgi:hypothetical protein